MKLENEVLEILDLINQKKNFVLSGGAGSGKTYSLISLLNNLLSEIPNTRIACLTYTNAAVKEINDRFQNNNLSVSTIHEFLWNEISRFQKAMKQSLLEIINDSDSKINNPNGDEPYKNEFENGIKYKEYIKLNDGIISHNEVLILAHYMFGKYTKLQRIITDKYDFIMIDEYQDTSEEVIEIFLDFLRGQSDKMIIGLFGDQMQSIYEDGIGDIQLYIDKGYVKEVEKKQNRRNPLSVINLANKIRTDSIEQIPSNDKNAPNMNGGKVIQGDVKFVYSEYFSEDDILKLKDKDALSYWDFSDSVESKELRLTHNLIADKAGYPSLMSIYDKDPIIKYKNEINKDVKKKGLEYLENTSFEDVINALDLRYLKGKHKGETKLSVKLEDNDFRDLYDKVRTKAYIDVRKIYFDKDNLIDDKKDDLENENKRTSKRDYLIKVLFKIQELRDLYSNQNYHEFVLKTGYKINSIESKRRIKKIFEEFSNMNDKTISQVIDYAHENKLVIKDDRFEEFIDRNWYLYDRVGKVKFEEFDNLYKYLEGYVPLSTQHKIKGAEFNNVLIILENGGWHNYNFEYLLNPDIRLSLTGSKKDSFERILPRTQKLFYVCCTRAKEKLMIYYPNPSESIIKNVSNLIGKDNVLTIDEFEKLYEKIE